MKRIAWCFVVLLASAFLLLQGCSDERGKPEPDEGKPRVEIPEEPDPGDQPDEPDVPGPD